MMPTTQPLAEPQDHSAPGPDNSTPSAASMAEPAVTSATAAETSPVQAVALKPVAPELSASKPLMATTVIEPTPESPAAPEPPISEPPVGEPPAQQAPVKEPITPEPPAPETEPEPQVPVIVQAPTIETHSFESQRIAPQVAEPRLTAPQMVSPAVVQQQPVQASAVQAHSHQVGAEFQTPARQSASLVMGTDSSAALRMPQVGHLPVSLPASGQEQHDSDTGSKKWKIFGLGMAALLVVVFGGVLGAYMSWRNSGQLANGLIIQGEPVGGLTKTEARQRLNKRFGRLFVTVETANETYKLGLAELGGRPAIDRLVENAYWYGRSGNIFSNVVKVVESRREEQRLKLPVQWDKARLRSKMWIVANQYNRKAYDAKLEVTDAGVLVVPHQEGRKLNVGATLARLQKRYYVGLPAVEAVTEQTMPRLSTADLAGTDVKLGEYPTRFNTGEWGRSKNLRLAAATINGQVIMPGEVFSFNKTTGERTWKKGYRTAHIFVREDGEAKVVEGLGGGICQVSSTLYNAVRKTNNKTGRRLKIVERNNHMLPVAYVPSGLDATVAWPYKDFKFRNTFPYPVYLRTSVSGGTIVASVWARVPDNVHSLVAPAASPASASGEKSAASSSRASDSTG